jgi:hypothetical protein
MRQHIFKFRASQLCARMLGAGLLLATSGPVFAQWIEQDYHGPG